MKSRRNGVAVALLLVALPAVQAQTQSAYRCGNTISQTPCGPHATSQRLHTMGAAASAPAHAPKGLALCTEAASQQLGTPEPSTVRVQPLAPRRVEVIRYANQSLIAHRYELALDAKNLQGFYTGPQRFVCWLSEDQARVLQLQGSMP